MQKNVTSTFFCIQHLQICPNITMSPASLWRSSGSNTVKSMYTVCLLQYECDSAYWRSFISRHLSVYSTYSVRVRVHLVTDHGRGQKGLIISWCRIWGYLVMTVINMTVRYFVIRLSTLKSIDQSDDLTSLTNQRPRKCKFFKQQYISTATFNLFNLFSILFW